MPTESVFRIAKPEVDRDKLYDAPDVSDHRADVSVLVSCGEIVTCRSSIGRIFGRFFFCA